MRYYQPEHESAYREIERLGHTQWNDLFDPAGEWTYDNFQNRAFLERVLPHLAPLESAAAPRAFEYGCGTGPAACWLATQGFQVDAIDLIPEAIALARRLAEERGLQVTFNVADICNLPAEPDSSPVTATADVGGYDLVLDSYCLQSIVTDEDRRAVFSAVRARLKPSGYYVISTALRGPGRTTEPGFFYDESTGISYREVPVGSVGDQVVELDGRWYVPHRRHLTADALRAELTSEGFQVLSMEGSDTANVVCRPTGPFGPSGTFGRARRPGQAAGPDRTGARTGLAAGWAGWAGGLAGWRAGGLAGWIIRSCGQVAQAHRRRPRERSLLRQHPRKAGPQ